MQILIECRILIIIIIIENSKYQTHLLGRVSTTNDIYVVVVVVVDERSSTGISIRSNGPRYSIQLENVSRVLDNIE